MNLIIVSGLSGSGKSIALHALEDLGYFCIDNLPFGMVRQLTGELQQGSSTDIERVAVSIDSRSREFLKTLSSGLEQLRDAGVTARIVFLEAGRIVERGSHDELMALGGRYRQLYDLQSRLGAEDAA